MRQHNRTVNYLLAPDEFHGFSTPVAEAAVYRAIELFLHEQIGGEVGPEPSGSVMGKLTKYREVAATADEHR
jgi:hypothetical protein